MNHLSVHSIAAAVFGVLAIVDLGLLAYLYRKARK